MKSIIHLFALAACSLSIASASPNAGSGGVPFVSASSSSGKCLVTAISRPGDQATATSPNGKSGTVKGCATHHAFLCGLIQWGSDGVGPAAKRAGITQVDTVDHGGNSILWGILYYSHSTIVTGETNVDGNGTQYMK